MQAERRTIIIYGGSFDPPHRGHMELAAAALRQIEPEAIYFVPGFHTPFKDLRPVPFEQRRALLKAALGAAGLLERPEVKISSFEAGLRRVVYTWETVAHFRKLHPGARILFLMGSDCLGGFRAWRRWRTILKGARLLVGLRPGYDLAAAPGVPFTALSGSFPRAASSDLRAALFLGHKPPELYASVLAGIRSRGLYLSRERVLLKKLLTPGRFRHSHRTAALAVSLAPALGVPEQKAAAAGLLHDCARDMSPGALKKYAEKTCSRAPFFATMLRKAPVLLHAWAGAALAGELSGIRDAEITEAIRLHATGAPGMGPLARLIYVCDLAAPGRDFPEAGLVRELAFRDFDAAFRAANYVKLTHAFAGGGWVHPLSVSLWNSLQEKKKG